MKEKELRLALVCYGGVSLAVYMHGVTREVQKLLRASKLLHQVRDDAERRRVSYDALNSDNQRETDSERIYFELLQRLGVETDLRVLVDIIAGASAGGINGIMLAHAITQDLPLDPLRDMWLRQGDIEQLLDPDAISRRWDKIYMRPLVWLLGKLQGSQISDFIGRNVSAEVKGKLSRFVRSRWFQPPFSGPGFARMLYNALVKMTAHPGARTSLLPPGYPFDLFVTVTDFFGYAQNIRLHSPPEIKEREHRLVLSFHDGGDDPEGKRHLGDLGDLAFAARATASYPGAFPPATLAEMQQVISSQGRQWPGKADFVSRVLQPLMSGEGGAEAAAFLDGSILNNKPFGEAIAALRGRPAHREVDRRIVYIEPNPARLRPLGKGKPPGFFTAIRASLSDIPRNQPIRDDLEWVQDHSARVERLRAVIDGMTADVDAEIEAAVGERLDLDRLDRDVLAQWRDMAHKAAARAAGYAYAAYAELKVHRVLDELALLLSALARGSMPSRASRLLEDAVHDWAQQKKILPLGRVKDASLLGEYLPWVDFLRRYDISFRVRRLRFVIRALNTLYANAGEKLSPRALDRAKQTLYVALGKLHACQKLERFPNALAMQAKIASAACGDLVDAVGRHFDLAEVDEAVDALLIQALDPELPADARRSLVIAFLGFPFFDVVTLPILQGDGLDEFDPIKVDRISPEDANAIRAGGARACLKGITLGSFGAFFSRAYRENDYLWGRLHAADRLVDIALSALPGQSTLDNAAIADLKQRLFQAILAAEMPFLRAIPDVFTSISAEVAAMTR
jgi:patatin-related protein